VSVEVVRRDNGDLFVIDGEPGAYDVYRVVTETLARYDRKYVARRAILDGEFDA
jgi:hypothetical protein